MNLAGWRDLIFYLNTAATVLLLGQLLVQGLYRNYPLLLGFFLADLTQEVFELMVARNSLPYFYAYLGGQAIKLAFAALVVLELYHRPLEGHPALAKFGRRAAGYMLLLLAVIAGVGLYFGPPVPPRRSPALHYFLSFERTMDSILVVFLIVISVFLLWFPLKVRRNAALYMGGFIAYFLARGAALLGMNAWPAYTPAFDLAALSCSLACLIAWVVLLRREGEMGEVVTGHRWNPEEMDRLTGQLEAINSRLMRIH